MPPAGKAVLATARAATRTSLGAPRRRTGAGPTAIYLAEEPAPGAPVGTGTPTGWWGSRARIPAMSPTDATLVATEKGGPRRERT